MLTPAQTEELPIELEKQFRDLEQRVMSDVVRRLKLNGNDITRSADWQINRLVELGKSQEEIKKYLANALKMSDNEIEKAYQKVIDEGYAQNEEIYKQADKDFIPYEDNQELQQLVSATKEQTQGEFKNITQSLGFATKDTAGNIKFQPIADYYQKTLDSAMLDIATGMFSYNTVLNRVVTEMTNSGLRTVDYASGWSNRVDVAARRAIMTGITQVTAKVNEDTAKDLGTNTFEVSYHSGARPSHAEWQGGIYTYEELETICGLGTGEGLCGWNCYHSYSPFIPGISEPTYTKQELARMKAEDAKPVDYYGKKYTKYEALQRQRTLETRMRAQREKIKLLQEGGADEDSIITARAKYRVTSSQYAQFSKAMNLPQQRDRIYQDGKGGIGKGKWKTNTAKSVAKSQKSGIINKNSISKSVKIPDDCKQLLKADTNFEDKNISKDVLRTIDKTIDKRLSEKVDFRFDEIKVAKFADTDKSVMITNLEVSGGRKRNQLYLNKSYFENATLEDFYLTCTEYNNRNWWKSKSLEDLVNHEIMHAKINNCNSYEKIKQLYQLLEEDDRVKGFCGMVDKYPSEFLNEMYVALHNNTIVKDKYLSVYNEYLKEFLGE